MPKLTGGRPGFREWVDRQSIPAGWTLMPLTHISKGIGAEDIIRSGAISTENCEVFNEPLAYFFYGRPAYRVGGDGTVKVEAACPYCFVFDAGLIHSAKSIHAFDTGAYAKRMYKHAVMEEMQLEDFSLETNTSRPNRVIAAAFSTMKNYFEGDITKTAPPSEGANPWEFHARAYLQLLASPGRNEPDDRICSIEIVFGQQVPLAGNVRAVVVPHTLWDGTTKTPWLERLHSDGIEIIPYLFIPGRHPEHYHTLLEVAVRGLYEKWGLL